MLRYAPNHGLAKGAYGAAYSDANELATVQKAVKVNITLYIPLFHFCLFCIFYFLIVY